jgi:gliding motility-associated protein GldC
MSKKSEIKFTVTLDEKKNPQKIEWEATDAGFTGKKECSSLLLSLWDKEDKATLAIDLWTTEMLVDEMNVHVHQSFLKMADTYFRATQNNEGSNMIRDFANEFADKLKLINKVQKKN